MNRFIVFACLFLISAVSFAQASESSDVKIYNKAVSLCEKGNHTQAVDLFKSVLENDPNNRNVLFSMGTCYLNINNRSDSAEVYFKKAVDQLESEEYNSEFGIDLLMSLAKTYQKEYKYAEAIKIYNKVDGFVGEELVELKSAIRRSVTTCNSGIELMKNPVKLEVHNLGPEVNSKYDDHSPLVSADESILLFTSKRKSSYSRIMDDGQFAEKIYTSSRISAWDKSKIVKSVVKQDSHESVVCISADGTELYILRSDVNGRNLYVSNFDGDTWSEPFMLSDAINSRFNETHASINSDKSVLFFTSDRKGGYGGLDIYMVRKLPNGEWGAPLNLGPDVNTPLDEETPTIHLDGKTLYFSSEGHNSMGSFDIFRSTMQEDGTWGKAVNMGYPINTPDDDFFFMPTADKNRAYMSSARFEDNYGGLDLYLVEYEEPYENKLAVVKGQLKNDKETAWDNVRIIVKEKGKEEVVGNYKPNPVTGKYLMILESDKKYDISFEGEGVVAQKTELAVANDMSYHNTQKPHSLDDTFLTIKEPEVVDEDVLDIEKYLYTVQFVTIKELLANLDVFKLDVDKIRVYECKDGNYRYVYGEFESFKDAKQAKEEVIKATGYDDPFVRYFWQLEKMKVEEK